MLTGPGRRIRVLERSAQRLVCRQHLDATAPRPALPPAPLILLALEPTPTAVDMVTELRRRYHERVWLAVAPSGNVAQVRKRWGELISGALEAPVGVGVVEVLIQSAAHSISGRRALLRSRRRAAELEERLVLLSDTIQAAGSLLDPGMVSKFIMERAAHRVGSPRWRLYRVDEVGGLMRLDAWAGPETDPPPAAELALEQGLAGRTARRHGVLQFNRVEDADAAQWEKEWGTRRPQQVLAVPLVSRGRVIGVAEFADPGAGRFSAYGVQTVQTLMEPAAIALDNAQLFRKLEERTVTDDLTGLYNARFMENYLRRETKRASRYGHPVAMLFIDLDGFKQVNDIHGHMAGSRTLVEVGQVLRENVREIDVAARWGGDEFTVVLPETDGEGARVMAQRICERIREHTFLLDLGLKIRISASVGVSSWPENGPTAAALLAAADAAMYEVKNSGKNGVFIAPSTRQPEPVPV